MLFLPVLQISGDSRSRSIPFIIQPIENSSRENSEAERQAAMDSSSPVMTESERRAYRYGQAPRVQGLGLVVRKSWSSDSLFSLVGTGSRGGDNSCICAPTTHPGSFRCKHHRQSTSTNLPAAGADEKRGDAAHEEISSAEQEKAS